MATRGLVSTLGLLGFAALTSALLLACNEDPLMSTLTDGLVVGDASLAGANTCRSNQSIGTCLAMDGCSWLHGEVGYQCYRTVCKDACGSLTRTTCDSCMGCVWQTASCVTDQYTASQHPCDAAPTLAICRSIVDCAWVTNHDGQVCIDGFQGPHS